MLSLMLGLVKCPEICHLTALEKVFELLAGCFGLRGPIKTLQHEKFENLAAETVFSISEVEALYELFQKLSDSVVGDGFIHKENFQLALFRNSKHENFFADRMFTVLFDTKKSGVIDFGEFVRSLGVFHPDTSHEQKVDFAFRLYDVKQKGLIERQETFTEVNVKGDGKFDKEEWKAFVTKHPSLMKLMTLPYLKTINTSFPSFISNAEAEHEFS